MEPELVVILASAAACTVGVAAFSLMLGLTRVQAVVWALIATAGLAALVVGGLITALTECLANDPDYPSSWHWSPRREFCDEESSPAQLGFYALAAMPPLLASLGVVLWSKGRKQAASVICVPLLLAFLLPSAYVMALPYYPIETTPVLHDPYLRVATAERPARACYVYGILREPPPPDADRICVDLARTSQASVLTADHSDPATIYALGWLGKTMTENGMNVGSEWEGLVVERVYPLPDSEARQDSSLVRT